MDEWVQVYAACWDRMVWCIVFFFVTMLPDTVDDSGTSTRCLYFSLFPPCRGALFPNGRLPNEPGYTAVCVSVFYVIDTGSIRPRARIPGDRAGGYLSTLRP